MSRSSFAELRPAFKRVILWVSPRVLRPWAGAAVLAMLVAHALAWWPQPWLNRLEGWLYDAKVQFSASGKADERLVIIDIDEASLAREGRWPWGRDRVAELVRRLFDEQGVLLLGIDMILAEPDPGAGHDEQLAAQLAQRPVVLGFHLSDSAGAARNGVLPPPLMHARSVAAQQVQWPLWQGYGANLPVIAAQAAGAGSLNAMVDVDGVARRAPLLSRVDDGLHPNFALAMTRALLGKPALALGFDESGFLSALVFNGPQGRWAAPVDAQGMALLPFRGKQGLYRYVSAHEFLQGKLAAGSLQGRIAILGTTAPGMLDQRATPVGQAYPGVEAHANLLSGLLDRSLKHEPSYARAAEVLALLGMGVVFIVLMPRMRASWGNLFALGFAGMVVTLNLHAWNAWQLSLPLATAMVAVPLLLMVHLFFGQFVESRARRRLQVLFGQYVPPELVDQMSQDPVRYSMEGRSASLTVLFADVRGFTAIAERLPPTELAALMNEYFSAMTDIVLRHRGTLDKYVGDAMVAFWGAPVADPKHAEHAVAAALAMQAALPELNRQFAQRGWPAVSVGIGVNSGPMVVGDMGSRHRRAYTVLGDAVNLGARFEGLCARYATGIVMGEATRRLVPYWPCRELDHVTVRGRSAPVTIYEPLPRA